MHKVEMNFSNAGGVESLNTDITYVDWVALPSEILAIGSGSDCTSVGCEVPHGQILNGCPPIPRPARFTRIRRFNPYAQWVHQTCPGIYALPYDDHGASNQSSDHTCSGATQLNVTFCPRG